MNISSRLKDVMKEKNIKAAEICKSIGLSSSIMSRYLSGQNNPPASTIGEIANYLNVSTDYLILGKKENNAILSDDENKLLKYYRMLNKQNKLITIEETRHLYEVQKLREMI